VTFLRHLASTYASLPTYLTHPSTAQHVHLARKSAEKIDNLEYLDILELTVDLSDYYKASRHWAALEEWKDPPRPFDTMRITDPDMLGGSTTCLLSRQEAFLFAKYVTSTLKANDPAMKLRKKMMKKYECSLYFTPLHSSPNVITSLFRMSEATTTGLLLTSDFFLRLQISTSTQERQRIRASGVCSRCCSD